MTAPKLLRYCFVLLLVLFQLQAGAVSAGTGPMGLSQADSSMPMTADCLDHKGDHCQMGDTASQGRAGCFSSGCGSVSILPSIRFSAPGSGLASAQGWFLSDFPPHTGYRNPLERPPSL